MKKFLVGLCVLIVFGFSGCIKNTSSSQVILLDEEQSFFLDFEVREDIVYLKCYLSVINVNSVDYQVVISANFKEDVQMGLLDGSNVLYACNELGEKQIFTIKANSTEAITCVFQGNYGGKEVKADRELPDEILFHMVDE